MDIQVNIDPELDGVRVVIHAPADGPEVEELRRRLSAGGPVTLLGIRDGQTVPLTVPEVLRFYGESKEVVAQTEEGLYAVKPRLYELEERLDPRSFVRISHSEIVNLRKVTALDLTLAGTVKLTLAGGAVCYASRRYVKKIKAALGL